MHSLSYCCYGFKSTAKYSQKRSYSNVTFFFLQHLNFYASIWIIHCFRCTSVHFEPFPLFLWLSTDNVYCFFLWKKICKSLHYYVFSAVKLFIRETLSRYCICRWWYFNCKFIVIVSFSHWSNSDIHSPELFTNFILNSCIGDARDSFHLISSDYVWVCSIPSSICFHPSCTSKLCNLTSPSWILWSAYFNFECKMTEITTAILFSIRCEKMLKQHGNKLWN